MSEHLVNARCQRCGQSTTGRSQHDPPKNWFCRHCHDHFDTLKALADARAEVDALRARLATVEAVLNLRARP